MIHRNGSFRMELVHLRAESHHFTNRKINSLRLQINIMEQHTLVKAEKRQSFPGSTSI